MKKSFFLLSVTALFATAAIAGSVNYNTTGVFNCNSVVNCVASSTGGGTNNVVTVNGISLTYNSTLNGLVAPTFTDFGTLVSACVNVGCSASPSTLAGILFVLTITQTVPSSGAGSFGTASLTGTIVGTGTSSAEMNFSANNTSSALCASCPGIYINPGPAQVLYQLTNGSKSIVPPSSGASPGLTSLQGAVTDSPEPVSLSLVGLGLIALASARRVKVKRS
jgi:hypothetical protein